jgi:hypothetical protein
MSDIEEETAITETTNETIVEDGEPTRTLQKPKKPRTEKQIEALKKAQIKRAENIEKRKLEKEQNKKLSKKEKLKKELEELEKQESEINPSNNGMNEDLDTQALIKKHEEELRKLALKNINKKPKAKKPVKQTIIYESESSETEEEEIIIKKKPKRQKPKKKPKKKVVYESSSSEESEESEEEYVEPTPQPRQRLRYSEVFRFS